MGAYKGLTKFFDRNLSELAARLGYGQDNLYVLSGDEQNLRQSFPEIYNNILSCVKNMDKRGPMEYAQDVVASWLFEDYLVAKFRSLGRTLKLVGGDRERKLLPHSKVSSNSDCVYNPTGDKKLKVEIMNSYTKFWKDRKCLHLRNDKYAQLCKEKGVLLCVDASDRTFAVIDFTKEEPSAKLILEHKQYGGKPAYELSLDGVPFYEFLVKSIIDNLDALME